jgi:hypothetical protein
MNANRINDYMTAVDSIDAPHYYASQTWRQALTWQAELCRRIGADFYYNAPFHASAKFNAEAVGLIRSILDADQRIYVSWCNELWNGVAAPYKEIERIVGVGMGGGEKVVFFDCWAQQLDATFAAARSADPGCVRVLETKTAKDGTWISGKLHERITGGYDAVALTTYFSPDEADLRDDVTVDQVFASAADHWRNDERVWQLAAIKWAADRGKAPIAYEGGQHFVDYKHRPAVVAVLRRCMDDPRMAQMYKLKMDSFFDAGGLLDAQFEFIGWHDHNGTWGLADSLKNLAGSLRYQTLVAYYAKKLSAGVSISGVLHLADNSARFSNPADWTGWLKSGESHARIIKRLRVGMVIRQPFPTASTHPMHVDGWSQNAAPDRAALWRDGYEDGLRMIADAAGDGGVVLYVGFPGGDETDWPVGTVGRPWADPPTLSADLPAAQYDAAWGESEAPLAWAMRELGAAVYFDACANIREDARAFAKLEALRSRFPELIGIESPPDLARRPYLKPYAVAATWASYRQRVESGRWADYTAPRLVFVATDLPAGLAIAGDVGGRSEAFHALMAERCRDVIAHGGVATLGLWSVYNAGYTDIQDWLDDFAPPSKSLIEPQASSDPLRQAA